MTIDSPYSYKRTVIIGVLWVFKSDDGCIDLSAECRCGFLTDG